MVRTHILDPTPDASKSYNLTLPIRLLIKDVWRQKCVLDSGVQDLQSLRKCVSHAVSTKQNTLGARNHESIPCPNTTSIWQQMKLIKNSREFNSCIKFLGAFQNAYSLFQMLNCILGMVDKTKRALTILQQRNVHGCGSATSPVGNPDPRNRCDNSCLLYPVCCLSFD